MRRDEQAIAAFRQGLDVIRVVGVVVERVTDLADRVAQRFLAAETFAPDFAQQRIASHEFAGGLGKTQ
ncbi:MAG: hypothetical protein R3358_06975 [Woeseiaceae bacterium]|nr:hypothetical protein [Woeseiaceae bacterium]